VIVGVVMVAPKISHYYSEPAAVPDTAVQIIQGRLVCIHHYVTLFCLSRVFNTQHSSSSLLL